MGNVGLKIILGALGVLVLLAGIWHTLNLRAENQALRDRPAKDESAAAAATPSSAPSLEVPDIDSGPRVLDEEARDILLAELTASPGKRVWFVTQPNDQEADLFQRELEDAFLESGWEIAGSSASPRSLRAGVRMFIADDDFPDHVSVALNGLRAIGLDVFAGRGYRAYYERQKEKDPNFSGVELAPDQDFVIVVGPKPSAP